MRDGMLRYLTWMCGLVLALAAPAFSASGKQPATGEVRELSARCAAVRAAVNDLVSTYGDEYAGGAEFLVRLGRIERRLQAERADVEALGAELTGLRRRALLANPLLTRQPILFVVRPQYRSDHHNTATMFQTGEINTKSFAGGGALKTIDVAKAGRTSTLTELPEGIIRDPEVHFDGGKIVFAMRRRRLPYLRDSLRRHWPETTDVRSGRGRH